MKILQIAPQIPYPVNDGGRISIFGITKYLSLRGHDIDFVAYRKNVDSQKATAALLDFCTPIFLEVKTDNSILGAVSNLFSSTPYNISKFIRKEMKSFLLDYLSKSRPDIIHVDHLHMAWVIEIIRGLNPDIPVVLREHNFETSIMKRYSENQKNIFLSFYARIQYHKLKKYESSICEKFDLCIMISSEDEKKLVNLNKKIKTAVIPAGVDVNLFAAPKNESKIKNSICHVGPLSWYPNLDGLQWFVDSVLPGLLKKAPGIKLFVFGSHTKLLSVPESLVESIEILGYVEDLWEHLSKMELAIVPLRIGGGIRIKVLEMMAFGINIISTPVGTEGIPVVNEKHFLITETESGFAEKIADFFNGKYNASLMKSESRKIILENFTWEIVSEKFEISYQKIINIYQKDKIGFN